MTKRKRLWRFTPRVLENGGADFKCRAGSRYLYVDEFGIVHWCSQQRGVFTKPRAQGRAFVRAELPDVAVSQLTRQRY